MSVKQTCLKHLFHAGRLSVVWPTLLFIWSCMTAQSVIDMSNLVDPLSVVTVSTREFIESEIYFLVKVELYDTLRACHPKIVLVCEHAVCCTVFQ